MNFETLMRLRLLSCCRVLLTYDDSTLEGPLTGTLVVRGSGDFFLRVSTTRSYEIGVEEARW